MCWARRRCCWSTSAYPRQADDQLRAWTDQGLRVLVFACNQHVNSLHDDAGEPTLPPLTLLGVVSLSDELRPHLKETLASFTSHGVRLKVISGDNPQTGGPRSPGRPVCRVT